MFIQMNIDIRNYSNRECYLSFVFDLPLIEVKNKEEEN